MQGLNIVIIWYNSTFRKKFKKKHTIHIHSYCAAQNNALLLETVFTWLSNYNITMPLARQRKTNSVSNSPKAAAALNADKGGAAAATQKNLPETLQLKMESAMNTDFSNVEVHPNSTKAVALSAYAYTQGNQVHFAPGQYKPETANGQELIGHELAHVVQQRQGRVKPNGQANGMAINDNYDLEQEADQWAGKANRAPFGNIASSTAAPVQMKSAGVVQMWNPFKKKKKPDLGNGVTLDNPTSAVANSQQTANPTTKVTFGANIGNSGSNKGFFKGDTGMKGEDGGGYQQGISVDDNGKSRSSARAVASSRLDKAIGTNVLSEEYFANVNGEKGSVSGNVDGKQLVSESGGQYTLNHFDMKNPNTQKGLSDLQLMDFLSNQTDRHGGNIFIGDNGKVKGIDNDVAFGNINPQGMEMEANKDQKFDGKEGPRVGVDNYLGLPSQVDAKTAKKILGMKAKNLGKILNDPTKGPDEQLSPEEIKAAQIRFRAAKQHIKGLKKTGGIVKEWNDNTYEKMSSDYDVDPKAYNPKTQGLEEGHTGRNYLARHEAYRENPQINAMVALKNATVEPAPQPVNDNAPTEGKLDPRMKRIINHQEAKFKRRQPLNPSPEEQKKQNMDKVLKEAFPFY